MKQMYNVLQPIDGWLEGNPIDDAPLPYVSNQPMDLPLLIYRHNLREQ